MRHLHTVSALALLLTCVPAMAEGPDFAIAPGTQLAQLSADALALLSDTRPATELSSEELTARIKNLRQTLASEELPEDVKNQLKGLLKEARTEVAAREAATTQQSAGQTPPEQAPSATVDTTQTQPVQIEPDPSPAVDAAPPLPAIVVALFSDTRPAAELSAEDLTARIKSSRQALKLEELPASVKEQLQALLKEARTEVAAREAATTQQSAGQTPPVNEGTMQAQPEVVPEPKATQQLPDTVVALLDDGRPLAELSADELVTRVQALRQASRREDVPTSVKEQLQGLLKQARSEIALRDTPSQQTAPEQAPPEAASPENSAQVPQQPVPEPDAGPNSADASALLADERQASELSSEELKSRMRAARTLGQDESLPEDTRNRLAELAKSSRRELMSRSQAVGGSEQQPEGAPAATPPAADAAQKQDAEAPPVVDQSNVQALDGNVADPQAEAKAQVYLQDQSPVETLTDEALRSRVEDIRDLLASNELSRDTERSVRRKLRVERDTLRARVAEKESRKSQATADQNSQAESTPSKNEGTGKTQAPATAQGGNNTNVESNTQITTNNTVTTTNITNITNLPPPRVVLADRRQPDDLDEREIRWRITVYRDAIVDEEYDEEERLAWRQRMEEDRRYLRRRLLEDRQRRERELEIDYAESNFDDMDINDTWDETAPPPRDVYVDEVDDEELVKVLAAPPRRKIERRYSVAEIEAKPQLRDTLARIEIDSVRFGFNEARVREEEINKLDRLGEVLERILRKNPKEVFLIEGHTDAVGSDAYNLRLSRQRAEAVKEALTTYFVIDPRNLKTVGFGERFLKIPTADAEEENRRVSIARATVLVGERND